jgi:hypothetical protein
MRLAKILSGGQTLRGGQTLALVQGLAIHRGAPYEIRYADHPSTHSIVDFAGVYVLYLVLAVGLPEPYAPGLLPAVVLPTLLDNPLPLDLEPLRGLLHVEDPSIYLPA